MHFKSLVTLFFFFFPPSIKSQTILCTRPTSLIKIRKNKLHVIQQICVTNLGQKYNAVSDPPIFTYLWKGKGVSKMKSSIHVRIWKCAKELFLPVTVTLWLFIIDTLLILHDCVFHLPAHLWSLFNLMLPRNKQKNEETPRAV